MKVIGPPTHFKLLTLQPVHSLVDFSEYFMPPGLATDRFARTQSVELAEVDRRKFLKALGQAGAAAGCAAASAWPLSARGEHRNNPQSAKKIPDTGKTRRPRVAAIFTGMEHRWHAHVLLENFLEQYPFNGKMTDPGVDVVSFWCDQFSPKSMTRQVAKDYQIPLCKTIAEALTCGGNDLAVDAVLSIGEHGKYPRTPDGVDLYPRKEFFDQAVAVMRKSGRSIPYFNDKHLCYRWDWAKEMYDTARSLGIPFMAGSSVPLAQRIPPLEIPPRSKITAALVVHGGELERYGFHGLEVLQSMVEGRQGGEAGISQVEILNEKDLWKGIETGRVPLDLVQAAMQQELGESGRKYTPGMNLGDPPVDYAGPPHGVLITYKDGLKGYMLKLGNSAIRWNFSCRIAGEPAPRATRFYPGTWNNRNLFRALSHAIQQFFITRQSPYPVERTLLTTGALAALVDSFRQQGKPVGTPHLEFAYQAQDFRPLREMGETWKTLLPEGVPEPRGIGPFAPPRIKASKK